eukprot:TRINITY_DN1949_c0_g2_i2.p1 TRINITY_DN1949_c0_g2~~TRINITY_DN1949_c0_g2_i2.p1  ORF type:complete len:365 (-),score=82.47 TRINITY_DN1949_c0_g2_i2:261-1280(-)
MASISSRSASQSTDTILMVDPVDFCFNTETAEDNEFQHNDGSVVMQADEEVTSKARQEWAASVAILRGLGVRVLTVGAARFNIEHGHKVPDAVFCNNWLSTHPNGSLLLYPMWAANRRTEANVLPEVLAQFDEAGLRYSPANDTLCVDSERTGNEGGVREFLEGTGSVIFDHIQQVAYLARSQRSSERLAQWLVDSGFCRSLIAFDATSSANRPYYHTNVMMCIGTHFAIVCLESIAEPERTHVASSLQNSGRTLVAITREQVEKYFCGNVLEVRSATTGHLLIVMSESSFQNGFSEEQKETLSRCGRLVALPVAQTIEFIGGGSARCMMCEVFLPRAE